MNEERSWKLDSLQKIVKKAVEFEPKVCLQSVFYIWEIDNSCPRRDGFLHTTTAKVLMQSSTKNTKKSKEKASISRSK